ncbi:MAG: hypothetical protein HQM08_19895 [Candidatus Riflebacteria bacterium]|nr:hypothetical protein [Candidatus Riflebacteria bacterium]
MTKAGSYSQLLRIPAFHDFLRKKHHSKTKLLFKFVLPDQIREIQHTLAVRQNQHFRKAIQSWVELVSVTRGRVFEGLWQDVEPLDGRQSPGKIFAPPRKLIFGFYL